MAGRFYAGTSGFSYPTWRGGFYPPDAPADEFLRHYARRLSTVELLATYHRLPTEQQLERWAAQTPPGFRFALRLTRRIVNGDLAAFATFLERARTLGERLGAVVARLPDRRPRDDGLLRFLLGSLDPGLRFAFDPRDESWDHPDVDRLLAEAGAVRVNDLDGAAGFRYLRLRDTPYDDAALASLAARLRPLLARGIDVYAYVRHEDEPHGPLAAERLAELVEGARPAD